MKKINFQKLSNKALFGSLSANRLDQLSSATVKAGGEGPTSTSLCETITTTLDADPNGNQEVLADKRCTRGY